MDPATITTFITNTFRGVNVSTKAGDSFFSYDPNRSLPENKWHPFATLLTTDSADAHSNLVKRGAYRLNIGVAKRTYLDLFGARPVEGDTPMYDFTALDRLMPHPVYGRQYWVCVVSPSDETFDQTIKPLLAEAYEAAVKRYGTSLRG